MIDMFNIFDPEELRLTEIQELSRIHKLPEYPKKRMIEPDCNMVLIDAAGNIRCMNHDVRILGALIFPPVIRIPVPMGTMEFISRLLKEGVVRYEKPNAVDFHLSSVQDGIAYYQQRKSDENNQSPLLP